MSEPSSEHERPAREIIDAAFAVHTVLGAGRSEAGLPAVPANELEARAIPFQRQVTLPVLYRNHRIGEGFRMDIVAGGLVAS